MGTSFRETLRPAGQAGESLRELRLDVQGRTLRIELSRARAVVFAARQRPTASPPGVLVEAGWEDGSHLPLRHWEVRERRVHLQIDAGSVEIDVEDFVGQLCWLEPRNDRVAWLSQLAMTRSRHVSVLSVIDWPAQTDRHVLGTSLRSRGRVHPRGLGVHSASSVAYHLPPGRWTHFAAELAIDDAGPRGSVRFRAYLGDAQLREVYRSDLVRGGQRPVPIRLPLHGATRLVLIVEHAEDGDMQDYANWLEAPLGASDGRSARRSSCGKPLTHGTSFQPPPEAGSHC